LPAFGLLDQVQDGDTGPAESTRRGNLQRVGLLFLGSRDNYWFLTFFDFLSLKNNVNVPSKSNEQKMLLKN
jgi:hypothetical protein